MIIILMNEINKKLYIKANKNYFPNLREDLYE